MPQIINLTPHAVTLLSDGQTYSWPPTAPAARAETTVRPGADFDSFATMGGFCTIRTNYREFGAPTGLPAPQRDTYYVVALLVVAAARAAGRTVSDLLTPGELVRDADGRITGCTSFDRHE